MTSDHIMYVCSCCADHDPECCGHYDRRDLAVMPSGEWLCESCWDDLPLEEKRDGEDDTRRFRDLPHPIEYVQKEPPYREADHWRLHALAEIERSTSIYAAPPSRQQRAAAGPDDGPSAA